MPAADAAPSSAGAAAPSAPAARDPFLDNARGILIALVVVGHALECFEGDRSLLGSALHTWIYSFHMAAFVAISGYLSRSYRNEPRQVRRLITAMALPYLIFQLIHEAAKVLLLGDEFDLQLVDTAWTLWFLLALMMWRLISPVLRVLRYPMIFALAVSVISPLDPGLDSTFTLGRFFQMMPFFVLGLIATPRTLEVIRTWRWRLPVGALVLAIAMATAFTTSERFSVVRFYLRSNYEDGPYSTPVSLVVHLLVLAAGVIGAVALLLVTPLGRGFLTPLGERSLTVYLLHPLVLLPIRYREEAFGFADHWWGALLMVLIGLGITAVLSRSVVARAARWVTDPPIGHLLVRDDERGKASQETPRPVR